MEAMYLAEEESRQEDVMIGLPELHQAKAGPSLLSDMECDGTDALGAVETNLAGPGDSAPQGRDSGYPSPFGQSQATGIQSVSNEQGVSERLSEAQS